MAEIVVPGRGENLLDDHRGLPQHDRPAADGAQLDSRIRGRTLLNLQMRTVWRVFAYLKRYPWMAAGTLGCAVVSTLMIIVFPAVTKFLIDDVIAGHRPELLLPMVGLALLSFFLQDLLNGLRILLNNSFEQKVIFDLRSDLFRHIELLPLRWFDNRATGDLITRVVEDVNSVERVLIDGIEQGVVAVLQVVIVIGTLFYFNGQLAWLRPRAGAAAFRRRARLHAHRAEPLPSAAARSFGAERAAAR